MNAPSTVVVLGCRAVHDGTRLRGALARRAEAALALAARWPGALVVAAGGRRWSGRAEACWLRDALVAGGVAEHRILRELLSLDTWENAREVKHLLASREAQAHAPGPRGIALVTCAWHLPRARLAFEAHGLTVCVEGPASSPPSGPGARVYRFGRERVAAWLDARRHRLRSGAR